MNLGQRALLGPLRQAFDGEAVAGLGEGQLLERFAKRRDEPAFAALMARHGPMVLGVCRRVLADPHDVEDAFQATFLILVRRAATLDDRDRLAPWLFGVARRVATRARRDAERRRSRERAIPPPVASPGEDPQARELGRAVVEEIGRLPAPMRDAVILCCVENLSYDEAASRLRCSTPALRGRLSRARERLRTRLTRRGFAPAATLATAWTWAGAASAKVPLSLTESTARAAIAFAAGRAATAGIVPATVVSLAEGAMQAMRLTRIKFVAAAVVAFGVAGSGVGLPGRSGGSSAEAQQPPAEAPPAPVEAPPAPVGAPRGRSGEAPAESTVVRPPRALAPEADRLGSLEQKIDRLIEAMENRDRPPLDRRPSTANPSSTGRPPLDRRPPTASPSFSSRERLKKSNTDLLPEDELGPEMLAPKPAIRPAFPEPGTGKPNESTRLAAVEQKLGRLEARIAAIEQKFNVGDNVNLPALPAGRRSPFDLDAKPELPSPTAPAP